MFRMCSIRSLGQIKTDGQNWPSELRNECVRPCIVCIKGLRCQKMRRMTLSSPPWEPIKTWRFMIPVKSLRIHYIKNIRDQPQSLPRGLFTKNDILRFQNFPKNLTFTRWSQGIVSKIEYLHNYFNIYICPSSCCIRPLPEDLKLLKCDQESAVFDPSYFFSETHEVICELSKFYSKFLFGLLWEFQFFRKYWNSHFWVFIDKRESQ